MSKIREYVLIKWLEYPPKWDVVTQKSIVTGYANIGEIVDVNWEKSIAQAEVLGVGKCFMYLIKYNYFINAIN